MNNIKITAVIVLAWALIGSLFLLGRPFALVIFWIFPLSLVVFFLYLKLSGGLDRDSGIPKLATRPAPTSTIPMPPIGAKAGKTTDSVPPGLGGGKTPPKPPAGPAKPPGSDKPDASPQQLGGKSLREFVTLLTKFSCRKAGEADSTDDFLAQLCQLLEIAEAQIYLLDPEQGEHLEIKACYPPGNLSQKKPRIKWTDTPLARVVQNGEQIFPGESPSADLMTPVPMLACTPLIDGVAPIGLFALEKTVRPYPMVRPDPEFFFFCGQMLGWVFSSRIIQSECQQSQKLLMKKVEALESHKMKLESTAAFLDQEVDRQYFENVDLEKQRSHLFSSFQKFLSPIIIEKIVSDPNALKLGGSKQHVTVFFSDIRGFTKMSEKMDPSDVVTLLNQYFSAMTAIVLKYQGTLDKFVGDEIMALFGAPLEIPHASLRAVMCALEMQQVLDGLKVDWTQRGFPVFEMGIGLNSGDVTVGFIGSEDVLSYTAIGDSVNLASRLCSIAGPGQIVVSVETARELEEAVFLKALPDIQVKGKELPIQIYEVVAPAVDLTFVSSEHFLEIPAEPPPDTVTRIGSPAGA